jgi:hypothetical protein
MTTNDTEIDRCRECNAPMIRSLSGPLTCPSGCGWLHNPASIADVGTWIADVEPIPGVLCSVCGEQAMRVLVRPGEADVGFCWEHRYEREG